MKAPFCKELVWENWHMKDLVKINTSDGGAFSFGKSRTNSRTIDLNQGKFKPITHYLGGVNVGVSPQSDLSVAQSALFRHLGKIPDLYFSQQYRNGKVRSNFFLKADKENSIVQIDIKRRPSWLIRHKKETDETCLTFSVSEIIKDSDGAVQQIRSKLNL
jgi:hypothetical protein